MWRLQCSRLFLWCLLTHHRLPATLCHPTTTIKSTSSPHVQSKPLSLRIPQSSWRSRWNSYCSEQEDNIGLSLESQWKNSPIYFQLPNPFLRDEATPVEIWKPCVGRDQTLGTCTYKACSLPWNYLLNSPCHCRVSLSHWLHCRCSLLPQVGTLSFLLLVILQNIRAILDHNIQPGGI